MVSGFSVGVFLCATVFILVFIIWSLQTQKKRQLLHRLFILVGISYVWWVIPLIGLHYAQNADESVIYFLDCLLQPGGVMCSPLFFCMSITFVMGYERAPKWMYAVFIVPVLTIIIAWTNPLHHLYYAQFSILRSQLVFGPYMWFSAGYNYIFSVIALVYLVVYGLRSRSKLYWRQCILFSIGSLIPLVVNCYATLSGREVPITATPMSFMVTVFLHGLAIFKYHMLDITPIATQHILNAISDSYIVLSENGLVIKFNQRFQELFAQEYGITENMQLSDCLKQGEQCQKSVIYNMLSALESAREGNSQVSYEQTMTVQQNNEIRMNYIVVDVTPLEINERVSGFVLLLKDVTQLRESMNRLQANQERMMEQERFAFLGQMIGGLAHNLKTPIMSISGCVSAAEALIDECEDSIGDPDVTEDDFREIYSEMYDWFKKIKESTAYMSDIITAIKGQAANISTDENITFTIDEMLKRSRLLMRHELLNSGCSLSIVNDPTEEITLQGDINNLVQVIGNLLSNSIFAQKQVGGGEIMVEITHDNSNLYIMVKDRGPGISEHIRQKLFKAMVTSKGTQGTGLGLYISNAVIRAKFNGEMWGDNRECGGSVFGIRIPLEKANIKHTNGIKEGDPS